MNKDKILMKLQEKLKKLQQRFRIGHELKVIYLPSEERRSDARKLRGEVQGEYILIYDPDVESATETLTHEFIESIIDSHTRHYVELINIQNKYISKLLYLNREGVVDKIRDGLRAEKI